VRVPQFIAMTWLALMCALAPACAEKRVALVIGNDRYPNLGAHQQLQKAVGDARAVGAALRQINFDVVEGENLGRQALIDRLDDVTRQASGATVFFFFSGHGVALDGANYILPADAPDVGAGQSTRLKGAAISEDYIQSELARAGTQVAVVVLDACRDNPFAGSGGKGVGGERGLVPQEPPRGVFALYAAGRGQKGARTGVRRRPQSELGVHARPAAGADQAGPRPWGARRGGPSGSGAACTEREARADAGLLRPDQRRADLPGGVRRCQHTAAASSATTASSSAATP